MSYVPPLLHQSYCLSSPQSSPGESHCLLGFIGMMPPVWPLLHSLFLLNGTPSTTRFGFTLAFQIEDAISYITQVDIKHQINLHTKDYFKHNMSCFQ